MYRQGGLNMNTMDFYLSDVWHRTLEKIKNSGQLDSSFLAYFEGSSIVSIEDNVATIRCPSFVNTTILQRFKTQIEFYLTQVIKSSEHIIANIVEEWRVEERKRMLTKSDKNAFVNNFLKMDFSENYTFANFVIGRSNSQAQVAALTVATNPGVLYNPLFIYGNSGLGKTHLMIAIANKIKELNPDKKIGIITGSDFVEGVYHTSKDHTIEEFKQSFHELDVLLIDDIQFIAGKDKTHEIFFTVFNDLVNNRKQICITADRLPSQIKGLEERIISRFNQGLNVNIEAPEFETCVNILKMKINNMIGSSQTIEEDVITYIATNFARDVRQLEGALTRLLFYSINFAPNKDVISIDVALAAFSDSDYSSKSKDITINRIKKIVSDYYGLTTTQLTSKCRTKNIANARHIAMYLCRKLIDAPYKDIGSAFGNRDHSTVINACDKIEVNLKRSDVYKQVIHDIESHIK